MTFVELPKLFFKLSFWQKLSYATIGTYYLVGATSFFFTLIPFLFFLTGVLPARMSFVDFLIRGSFVAFISISIYLYMQKWLCQPGTERGLHWRGMVLKFAGWPVFFLGFLLSIVNADIPYIPTAKKAVTGSFSPFARPLVVHCILFVFAFFFIFIKRRFFVSESMLVLSAEKVWGMMGFGFIAFLMSVGGIYAALESQRMKVEEPWSSVDINSLKKDHND